jgi:hypothetical protein
LAPRRTGKASSGLWQHIVSESDRKLARSTFIPAWRIPDSAKIHRKEHYNPMANWKVIALVNGDIEAVSDPAAQGRPGTQEWTVWEGPTADKAEALKSAVEADHRVDQEWMRIRYERDLDYW